MALKNQNLLQLNPWKRGIFPGKLTLVDQLYKNTGQFSNIFTGLLNNFIIVPINTHERMIISEIFGVIILNQKQFLKISPIFIFIILVGFMLHLRLHQILSQKHDFNID